MNKPEKQNERAIVWQGVGQSVWQRRHLVAPGGEASFVAGSDRAHQWKLVVGSLLHPLPASQVHGLTGWKWTLGWMHLVSSQSETEHERCSQIERARVRELRKRARCRRARRRKRD